MATHSSITRELNCSELVLQSERAAPTLGGHLNQAWSWPERQERSGNVAEAPMLTMPNEHSRHGSALVVTRSYRA